MHLPLKSKVLVAAGSDADPRSASFADYDDDVGASPRPPQRHPQLGLRRRPIIGRPVNHARPGTSVGTTMPTTTAVETTDTAGGSPDP